MMITSSRFFWEARCRVAVVAAGFMALAFIAGLGAVTVQAAETVFIPMFTYRTGPFAPNGTPIANGFSDYLNLLKGALFLDEGFPWRRVKGSDRAASRVVRFLCFRPLPDNYSDWARGRRGTTQDVKTHRISIGDRYDHSRRSRYGMVAM